MTRRLWVVLTATLCTGCATSRVPTGFITAESSNQSTGNSSNDSSGPSNNSSNQSSGSSNESVESSAASRQSSGSSNNSSGPGGSSDVNASSGRSSAQSSQGSSQQSGQSSGVVSGVGLLLTTTAGTGFAIYGTVMALKPKPATPETALRYLRANEDQLRQDLALGSGPTLDDLASAAEIRLENADKFRALLQSHRRELLDLAEPSLLNAERAVRFLSRIGELAYADDTLRLDAEAFRARHGG